MYRLVPHPPRGFLQTEMFRERDFLQGLCPSFRLSTVESDQFVERVKPDFQYLVLVDIERLLSHLACKGSTLFVLCSAHCCLDPINYL